MRETAPGSGIETEAQFSRRLLAERWRCIGARLRKARQPFQALERRKGPEIIAPREAGGRKIGDCVDELLLVLIPADGTATTEAVGGVVILGRNQLDATGAPRKNADIAAVLQFVDDARHCVFGAGADSAADFVERWADAMCFHMGADEFEKFCAAWAQRSHRASTP